VGVRECRTLSETIYFTEGDFMKAITKMSPWLMIVIFSINFLSLVAPFYSELSRIALTVPVIMSSLIIFLWYFSVSMNLSRLVPTYKGLNIKYITFGVPIAFIYFGYYQIVSSLSSRAAVEIMRFIFPIHVFSTVIILYCLFYISKSLVSLEKSREANLNEYLSTLFMFWFLPLGIWKLKPRILKQINVGK
jgi:hypothetical protein